MDSLDFSINVSLKELVDIEMFQEVCTSYYSLFDIPVRIFDQNGALLVEAATAHPGCNYINSFDLGRKKCTEIRTEVKKIEPRGSESKDIDCICGFRYSIKPITFQKENLGKVVFGPYVPADMEKVPDAVASIDVDFSAEKFKQKLTGARRISKSAVDRIIHAMISVLDVILFSSHKAFITSQMHLSAVRESFRDLSLKNRELERMNQEMKEFERLKSNFLATISHELRTPLTSIIGYSDLLAEGIAGALDAEQQQFINTIQKKGEELLNLISSILDFTKIDTGHLDLQIAEANPVTLVNAVVKNTAASAERRGIKVTTELMDSLPVIYVDPKKIETALSHLVENAIKFSSPGGVVKVSARIAPADETDSSGDNVGFVLMSSPDLIEFTVEDFGVGIPEAEQAHIFEPFVQLDASATREHDGAGLGLAIVKQFVEAHGGRIHVSSRFEEGSKFTIRMPIFQNE